MKAERNKTIDFLPEDAPEYLARCLRVTEDVPLDAVCGRTICGDTFQVAPHLPRGFADLLIVDPPYNLTKDFSGGGFRRTTDANYAAFTRAWIELQRLGVTEDEIRRARPHIDNSAYSHYMLCEAQAGDVLTGLVTLLNCSWSYAYIAQEMAARYPDALQNEHYGAWFAGYVSEEYRQTNQALIDRIDALGADIDEQTTQHLCEIFQTCCLFDLRFWDMVYAMGET